MIFSVKSRNKGVEHSVSEAKSNPEIMEHGSHLIERIKTDFKTFKFGCDPIHP